MVHTKIRKKFNEFVSNKTQTPHSELFSTRTSDERFPSRDGPEVLETVAKGLIDYFNTAYNHGIILRSYFSKLYRLSRVVRNKLTNYTKYLVNAFHKPFLTRFNAFFFCEKG